jgi:hypothetical protein
MECFCLCSSSTELIELNWKNKTHSLISVTVHVRKHSMRAKATDVMKIEFFIAL